MKVKWLGPLSIIALIIIGIAVVSWFAFPQWKNTDGGFMMLLGIVTVSAVPVIREIVTIIKEWNSIKDSKQSKDIPGPEGNIASNNIESPKHSIISYNEIKPVLRSFVTEALSEQELREVISDYFAGVKLNISSKSSIREMVDELINYSVSQGRVEYLIEITGKYNPYQYNKYKKDLAAAIPNMAEDKG